VFWIVMTIFVAGILVAPVIAVISGRRPG